PQVAGERFMRAAERARGRARPVLEVLEERVVPDATTYVQDLYAAVLGRTGGAGEVAGWVRQLQAGLPEQAVATAFWRSAEHGGLQVDRFYQVILHRAADASGRQNWVDQFVAGAGEVDVQNQLLASGEYQGSHPTDALFVQGLYEDVLGREPDP